MKNIASTTLKAFTFSTIFCLSLTLKSFGGDARGYVAPATEIKGMVFYHLKTSGHEKYVNGDKAGDDFNLESNIQIFRPIYYFKTSGNMATVQALIPFGDVSLDGKDTGNVSFSSSGLGDISILTGMWLIDDPISKTWFGISEWIKIPTGEYDNNRVLNIGTNQWAFKTEMGLAKGFGNFYLEFIPSAEFYTDNSDYGPSGSDLEKEPVFVSESHLSADITKTFIISLDHYYKKGGETSISGASMGDEASNHSAQISFIMKMSDNQRLLLQYLEDLEIKNGPKTTRFGLRYTFLL